MKCFKYILFALMLLPLAVTSCGEDSSGEEDEYANWQEKNDAMTNKWAVNTSLRRYKSYTKDQNVEGKAADYVYVEVLDPGEEGRPAVSEDTPLYTDSMWVAYRTRIIPTTSYPEGKVIDETYSDEFSWKTATFLEGEGWIAGFQTAVMNMHTGDFWRVYIPYQLAYGSNSSTPPAYSNLIIDIALYDFWHPGDSRPNTFK